MFNFKFFDKQEQNLSFPMTLVQPVNFNSYIQNLDYKLEMPLDQNIGNQSPEDTIQNTVSVDSQIVNDVDAKNVRNSLKYISLFAQ